MTALLPALPEARSAPRSSLMLRMAKLVCQSGEYLCIVRDVSAEGVGLRFLHAVPPEPRIILALANGATYPVERVWSGKQQAGYRFASAIDVEEFIHEPAPFESRPVRLVIRSSASIEAGGLNHPCFLADLSKGGAMIECTARLALGCQIALTVPGLARRLADVCWRKGEAYGLSFAAPMSTGELAEAALVLQPFESNAGPGKVQAA